MDDKDPTQLPEDMEEKRRLMEEIVFIRNPYKENQLLSLTGHRATLQSYKAAHDVKDRDRMVIVGGPPSASDLPADESSTR